MELHFPGRMGTYAVDDVGRKDDVTDVEWSYAFVSSVVRSFHAFPDKAVCIQPPLKTTELYLLFIESSKNILAKGKERCNEKGLSLEWQMMYWRQVRIVWQGRLSSTIYDSACIKSAVNSLSFVLRLRKSIVVTLDKIYLGFMIKAKLALGNVKEAVIDSVGLIKRDPENASLHFYQGKGLLELKMRKEALAAAQTACELCSGSTSAWVLLSHCHFLNADYKRVLRRAP